MPPERRSKPRNAELAAISRAIEERRVEKGISQEALAEASGITLRRIGDYVRGQHSPNTANLRRLCKALDLTTDELFKRAEELEEEPSTGPARDLPRTHPECHDEERPH